MDYVDQPYHYNVEFKRSSGKESVRATRSDKITGDEYNKGDVGLVNREMQHIRNHSTPWWRPALNMRNPEIDLSTVKVIISMDDHVSWSSLEACMITLITQVHSSFCSERGEVKGRKMTIGAEVAEDWNFLAIYNGLVVGVADKSNELVLQTKTGDPHQLWKFKDGLLLNKTGLVAECKPRGFPKWWQVGIFTKLMQSSFFLQGCCIVSIRKGVAKVQLGRWAGDEQADWCATLECEEVGGAAGAGRDRGEADRGPGALCQPLPRPRQSEVQSGGSLHRQRALRDQRLHDDLAEEEGEVVQVQDRRGDRRDHREVGKVWINQLSQPVLFFLRWELEQGSEEPPPQPLIVTIAFFVGGKKITEVRFPKISSLK